MRALVVLSLLVTSALAGCTGDGDGDAPADIADPLQDLPQLHGWVFDPALVPLQGVQIQANVAAEIVEVTTDAEGFYGFDELPVNQPVIIIARLDEYDPKSVSTTLAPEVKVQMNLTLTPKPVKVPYSDALPWEGFINCQYRAELSEQKYDNECGGGTSENQWQIPVGADFAGGVIEIQWEENTPLSHNLHGLLECATPAACGDDIPIFSEAIGPSMLRLEISNLVAKKYLPSGGIMLLTVFVDPANDANESAIGVSAAVSQSFEAIASLFYVEPPPPGYSAA